MTDRKTTGDGPERSPVRRGRGQTATKEQLLLAARRLAAEQGWSAVTIRRLAERLDYASPILYQHFDGKDGLLRALVIVGFEQIAQELRRAAEAPLDRRLDALAQAYWDFAFSAPELYQAMNGLDGVPFGTSETPDAARDAFTVFRGALESIATGSGTRLAEPDDAVVAVWAFLHGTVTLAMSHRIAGGPERARRILDRTFPHLFRTQLVQREQQS